MGGAAKLTRKMSGKLLFGSKAKTAATALIALLLLSTVAALFPSIIPAAMASPAATITLNPSKGTVGTLVAINGRGFRPGQTVTVYFDANGNGIYERGEVWATATVEGDGTFTVSEKVPSVTAGYGDYRVYATDGVYSALAYFTVAAPEISIDYPKGTAGTPLTVKINYFSKAESAGDVQIFFDKNNNEVPDTGDVIVIFPQDGLNNTGGNDDGTSITVPEDVGFGTYKVVARNVIGEKAVTTFTVMQPVITISPAFGIAGRTIEVKLGYYNITDGAQPTYVFFDTNKNGKWDAGEPKKSTPGDFTLDDVGNATITDFQIPSVAPGEYRIYANNSLGQVTYAVYTVKQPLVEITPTKGVAGTEVTINIYFFDPTKDVTVWIDVDKDGVIDSTEVLATITPDANGNKTDVSGIIPAGIGYGIWVVNATNKPAGGAQSATTTFTVMEPTISISPDKGTAGTEITVNVGYYNKTAGAQPTYVFFDTNGNGRYDEDEPYEVVGLDNVGNGSVTLTVPDGVGYGPYTVYANNSLGQVTYAKFTVMEPVITISPTFGGEGAIITVTINYFNKTAGAQPTYVFFDTNGNGVYDDGEPKSDGLSLNNTGGATTTIQVPFGIPVGVYKVYAVNKYQSKYSEFTVVKPEQEIEKKLDEIVIPKLDEIVGLLKDDTFGLNAIRTAIGTLASRIEEIAGAIMDKLTTIEGKLDNIEGKLDKLPAFGDLVTKNWADLTGYIDSAKSEILTAISGISVDLTPVLDAISGLNAKLGAFNGTDTVASLLYEIKASVSAINWTDITAIKGAVEALPSKIDSAKEEILTAISGISVDLTPVLDAISGLNAKLGAFNGTDTVASLLYNIRGRLEAITPGAQAASGSGATQFTSSQSVVIYSGAKVGTVTVSIKTSGVTYGERLVIRYYLDNTNYIEKVVTSSRNTAGWTDTAAAMKVELVYTWISGTDTVYYAYSVIYPPSS